MAKKKKKAAASAPAKQAEEAKKAKAKAEEAEEAEERDEDEEADAEAPPDDEREEEGDDGEEEEAPPPPPRKAVAARAAAAPPKPHAVQSEEEDESFDAPVIDTVDTDHVVVEKDKLPNLVILVSILAICGVTVALIIAVGEYFRVAIAEEKAAAAGSAGNVDVRELRATEERKLGHYQWVSKKDEVLRIPVDRAKELTLRDWKARPVDPPYAPPAPAPSASAAPEAPPAECDEKGLKSKVGEFYARKIQKDKKDVCQKCTCNAGKDGGAPAYECADTDCKELADYEFDEKADESGVRHAKKKDAGEAPKDEPKKDEPKKDEPKKDEPKKDEPKKDAPKKEPAKAPVPAPAPTKSEPY